MATYAGTKLRYSTNIQIEMIRIKAKYYTKQVAIIFGISFLFTSLLNSCMKDDMRPITEFNTGSGGVFIVCEGNFMYGNSSLSYYNSKTRVNENTVFLRANGIPLGDVAQSLTINDSVAWIVINNSGKVYAIDINSFKIKGKITGLTSPRYMRFINSEKAYISDMYAKRIFVVNPQTFAITNTISIHDSEGLYMRHSSEQMVIFDNKMFVNSWSYDNKILVIDTENDKLIDTIEVLIQPRKILADKNKKLWVLCDGGYPGSDYSGDCGILKIDMESHEIEKTFALDKTGIASDMQINKTGDTIFLVNGDVYRFPVSITQLPSNAWIAADNRNLFAIGQDPYDYNIYISDAVDYMQSGVIYRYNPKAQCTDTFTVGITPNSFVFK